MDNQKIKEGMKAPAFSLADQSGESVSLKEFLGKWLILYFYPRDNTPGCTVEAIEFSALIKEFAKLNAEILGVSQDSCESHQKFIEGKKLTVRLLSDDDSEMQKTYGVWRKKKFMGREFTGTVRTTVLINPKGEIIKIWDPVKAKGHAKEVLTELESHV